MLRSRRYQLRHTALAAHTAPGPQRTDAARSTERRAAAPACTPRCRAGEEPLDLVSSMHSPSFFLTSQYQPQDTGLNPSLL